MVSVWEKETYYAPQDVVIIGSGFVGLWSALHLKKAYPNRRITILERGLIPTGASTRNAGFACFGSLSELLNDVRTMGTDDMLSLVELRYKGLASIEKRFAAKKIGLDWSGGYELYGSGQRTDTQLEDEIAYMNALIAPVTRSKRTFRSDAGAIKQFGFGNTGHVVRNKQEGGLHSGKLIQALVREVSALGVTILTSVHVTGWEKSANGFRIISNLPEQIPASQILCCTNAFARDLAPELDIVPARGQVLLTAPIPGLSLKGTFHAEEGYYYFRDLGDRVLLGGARHKDFEGERTHEMFTSENIQQELEQYLRKVILPHTSFTIERRWSGIMAMGGNKLPIVRELEPGIFCAVRMSGMGVALAPVVGEKVSRLMK